MAQVAGVPVELITSFGGVPKALVRNLGGVTTAAIGFGPDAPPLFSCNSYTAYYHPLMLQVANQKFLDAVEGTEIYIEFDENNGFFYQEGQCGQNDSYAATGYYVFSFGRGETVYYYWDEVEKTLNPQEPPPPVTGPTLNTALTLNERLNTNSGITLIPLTIGEPFVITNALIVERMLAADYNALYADSFYLQADRGSWSGTGDISYMYEWYHGSELIASEGPYPYFNSKSQTWEDSPTSNHAFSTLQIGSTVTFKVLATDNTGTTIQSVDLQVVDPILDAFLATTRINTVSTVSALKYLRQQMLKPRANSYYATRESLYTFDSLLTDYYPIAGDTQDQQKWSLKNPTYALQFSGSLVGYRPSYWQHDANGMISTDPTNTNNNITTEFSTSYYATPNTASKGFAFGVYSNTAYTAPTTATQNGQAFQAVSLDVSSNNISDAFTYNPSIILPQIVNGNVVSYYTASQSTYGYPYNGTYVYKTGSAGMSSIGLSGLMVQDGTNDYYYNTGSVYAKVFTSSSIWSNSAYWDMKVTGSNKLPTDPARIVIHGDYPINIQFIYATQLPVYGVNWSLPGYEPHVYLQQLATVIQNYNTMLGR